MFVMFAEYIDIGPAFSHSFKFLHSLNNTHITFRDFEMKNIATTGFG